MSGPTSVRYQWKRDGAAIPGATSATYELQEADVGAAITVTVRASNDAGAQFATSRPTAAVAGRVTGGVDILNLLVGDASDFEGGTGRWTATGHHTAVAASRAQALRGQGSLAVTATRAGTARVMSPVVNSGPGGKVVISPVHPGTVVAPSCWIVPATTARAVQLQVLWWRGSPDAPSLLSAAPAHQAVETAGTWSHLAGPAVTAPAGASGVSLQVYVAACDDGEVHYIDSAALAATCTAAQPVPSVPANGRFGMYMPESAYTSTGIAAVEATIGRHLDLLIDYQNWDSGGTPIPVVPEAVMAGIGARDYMWTIQPSSGPYGAGPADCVNFPQLIAGAYDGTIVAFADWVNSVWGAPSAGRGTLYVRFAHEMNGTGWYDWQVGGSCGVTSPAMYAEAFDHFASVLTANTPYVKTIFAPNCGPTDNIADFYPPSCDILGMDGYNNVASATWETDQEVFAETYGILASLDPAKEIWICETACSEPESPWTYDGVTYPATYPTNSKATWVTNLLNSTAYPRLTTLVWFNIQKERDWVVNSSADSLAAFYAAFVNSRNGAL